MSTWSPRVGVNRTPKRGSYDRHLIDAVLDEGFVAHVGFLDKDQPWVIPMVYGRDGDDLYLHGSSASRQLRLLQGGAPLCVTVTNLRDLVFARSALNLSMNYQSVVVIGLASPVTDDDEKIHGLKTVVDHVLPDRWGDLRPPSTKELAASAVVRLRIDEASFKARHDPPFEEPGDELLPVWGGLLPISISFGPPVPDQHVTNEVAVPAYVAGYGRPFAPPPTPSLLGPPAEPVG